MLEENLSDIWEIEMPDGSISLTAFDKFGNVCAQGTMQRNGNGYDLVMRGLRFERITAATLFYVDAYNKFKREANQNLGVI